MLLVALLFVLLDLKLQAATQLLVSPAIPFLLRHRLPMISAGTVPDWLRNRLQSALLAGRRLLGG